MKTNIESLVAALQAYDGPPLRLMEVCGTHTHQLSHFGIPALLPPTVSLISGPGCPVCVTPSGYIARAATLSLRPNTTVLSFGDMLRVPGHGVSLLQAKAQGGSVAMMYSPMDAIAMAEKEPSRMFYVAAVGFETTLPLYALLVQRATERGLHNIRLLPALKALVPGLAWICQNEPDIHGFLGPGHVSAILGYGGYEALCRDHRIPMTVAGFGYEQLIAALWDLVSQARRGQCQVHNLYPGVVSRAGNEKAQALIRQVFLRKADRWRGLGILPDSGYFLRPEYSAFDASAQEPEADDPEADEADEAGCGCGQVILGRIRPVDCGQFGRRCTPEHPLGPCMVSSEGACGIWHASARKK